MLALSAAAAGCGGSGAMCGVAPCGGDVVGNWQASSACVDEATLRREFIDAVMGSCATASIGTITNSPGGTVSFAADMTYTGTLAVASTLDLIFPEACIPGVACDALTRALQSQVGTNGITAVSCAGQGGCSCTYSFSFDRINGTGTWATSGTKLTLTGATSAQTIDYCVDASSLHLLELDMTTMTNVVGDVVLSRQ